MNQFPSIGLIEIIIIFATVAGLTLLVGGLVLVLVIIRQRDRSFQDGSRPGPNATTSKRSSARKWLILLSLVALLSLAVLLLPLAALVGGFLLVTPVKSTRTDHQGPAPQVQVVAMPTSAIETSLTATSIHTPQPTSDPGVGVVESSPPRPASLSITPDNDWLLLILPGIAGVMVLAGVLAITVVRARWQENDTRSQEDRETGGGKGSRWGIALVTFAAVAALSIFVILTFDFSIYFFVWFVIIFAGCLMLAGLLLLVPRLVRSRKGQNTPLGGQGINGDNGDEWVQTAKLRYGLLGLAIWFALSIFLILDVLFAVSVYFQFVAIYIAFWALIGMLLLIGSPRREKLLILSLLIAILFSIRFVDWNSRKPFLKDFYRVKEGMTVGQVEQIMGGYIGGTGWPTHPLGLPGGKQTVETEELAQPDRLVYRHTNEGWGNSDWGEIVFEKGRVVQTRFLPD